MSGEIGQLLTAGLVLAQPVIFIFLFRKGLCEILMTSNNMFIYYIHLGMLWNSGDSKTGQRGEDGWRKDNKALRARKCVYQMPGTLEEEDKDEEDELLTKPAYAQCTDNLSENPLGTSSSSSQQPLRESASLDLAEQLLLTNEEMPFFPGIWNDQLVDDNENVVIGNDIAGPLNYLMIMKFQQRL